MDSIFKNKARKEGTSVINLEILVVLVIRLLKQDFNRLVNGIKPMELWDKGQLNYIVSYELYTKHTHVLNVLMY